MKKATVLLMFCISMIFFLSGCDSERIDSDKVNSIRIYRWNDDENVVISDAEDINAIVSNINSLSLKKSSDEDWNEEYCLTFLDAEEKTIGIIRLTNTSIVVGTQVYDITKNSNLDNTRAVLEHYYSEEPQTPSQSDQNTLEEIHAQISKEMSNPKSLIYGVGIGWAVIDGEVTGFGADGKDNRVVIQVDSTVYDSYVEKWTKLYGDSIYVEPVTAIIQDEVSIYSDLINLDSVITAKAKNNNYKYGTKEITFLITNHTDKEIMFGDIEIFEKLVDGIWYTIYQDYMSDALGYISKANATTEYTVMLPTNVLTFEEGTYRIIKTINDNYYSAEFKIDNKSAFN